MEDNDFDNKLFSGLKSLAKSSFPKKCSSCGKVYDTVEAFIEETENVSNDQSGLKESTKNGCQKTIEVYRNCVCGSVLTGFFNDRRDLSKQGIIRREKFGDMLCLLVNQGVDVKTARRELLKVLRGEESELVAKYRKS